MRELADEVYSGLTEAIGVVNLDLTYNARKFLGIELWPESIWSMVTFLGTIAIALAESTFKPS